MNKLNVFSEKLGKALEVSFREDGILVTPEGIPVTGNGIVFAWNNSSGSWVDNVLPDTEKFLPMLDVKAD